MRVTTKARGKKSSEFDELATCPVNGAGWCPYPFSMAQLKRRLKAKAAAAGAETATKPEKKAVEKKAASTKLKRPAVKASS